MHYVLQYYSVKAYEEGTNDKDGAIAICVSFTTRSTLYQRALVLAETLLFTCVREDLHNTAISELEGSSRPSPLLLLSPTGYRD